MNLLARARRLFFAPSARSGRRMVDLADMGTAFGLDAITTLQPESAADIAARQSAAPANRMQLRLDRRSAL
ncbi:MAG: hypothetical protein ABI281_12240 [Caldimonas sp.]